MTTKGNDETTLTNVERLKELSPSIALQHSAQI